MFIQYGFYDTCQNFQTMCYRPSRSRIMHTFLRTTSIVLSKKVPITTFSARYSLSRFVTRRVHSIPTIPTFDSTLSLSIVRVSHLVLLPSTCSIQPLCYCASSALFAFPCSNHMSYNKDTLITLLKTPLPVKYIGSHQCTAQDCKALLPK